MIINNSVPIGGFQKQSLIDYASNISAVIFTGGCNFRCNYCHNMQLIGCKTDASNNIPEECVFEWLSKNKGLLDAVVITGGEPTLHKALPEFIRKIKQLGLKVKLDTNGTNPALLMHLINEKLVDYVAMDIKAPLSIMKYRKVVGEELNDSLFEKVLTAVEILNQKLIDCEFRTTFDDSLSMDDFKAIASRISGKYFIQKQVDADTDYIKQLDLKMLDIDLLKSKDPIVELR